MSRGKYEVLRRDIEELAVENWLSWLYIFNQGGSFWIIMVGQFYFIIDKETTNDKIS